MRKTIQLAAYAIVVCSLTACGTEKVEHLHSPCAAIASEKPNPCGPKRPANDWWLKQLSNA